MGISFDAFIFDLVTTIHQGGTLCIPLKMESLENYYLSSFKLADQMKLL